MNIRVADLEKAFESIISKLKNEGVDSIEIESDMYRFIPASEWQKFEKAEVLIGSLSDDIESIKLLVDDEERPCSYVDFDRVASILNAISENRNPSEAT